MQINSIYIRILLYKNSLLNLYIIYLSTIIIYKKTKICTKKLSCCLQLVHRDQTKTGSKIFRSTPRACHCLNGDRSTTNKGNPIHIVLKDPTQMMLH